jgi:hypothetical protein
VGISFNIAEWNTDGAGPRFNVGALPESMQGLAVQPDLAKVEGNTQQARRAALLAEMKKWSALGVQELSPHGFTTSLGPDDARAYVDMTVTAGMKACSPAFGLNEDDPPGKGARIALVARVPGVTGVVEDAETLWEIHSHLVDADAAVSMNEELTSACPGVVIVHQPWPVPQAHKGFPNVAFGRGASAWGGQWYFNAWASAYGTRRVRVLGPEFGDYQLALDRDVMAPKGVGGIPRIITLEGYGWSDIPYDCCGYVIAHRTIRFWCEWKPTPEVMHAWESRQRIDAAVGLFVNGQWSGGDAVLRFQRAYNARPGTSARSRLVEDGVYGPMTDRALFGSPVARFFVRLARAINPMRLAA